MERNRRIAECDDGGASDSKERQLTYDRLVVVQEDLLRTIRRMQVQGALVSALALSVRGW